VLLFALALPLVFTAAGTWFVYLGTRSWHGQGPRPSTNIVFAGTSPRVRRFVDRSILPLGLLCLSLGITLGLAGAAAEHSSSIDVLFTVAISLTATASATFLALTLCVFRYSKPRRLVPAYLRDGARSDSTATPGARLR